MNISYFQTKLLDVMFFYYCSNCCCCYCPLDDEHVANKLMNMMFLLLF